MQTHLTVWCFKNCIAEFAKSLIPLHCILLLKSTEVLEGIRNILSMVLKMQLYSFTRIMVSKGIWTKTSTQKLRVFWHFWVLVTLTFTLNPICPVLRYPYEKQLFSTEYPSNTTYFPGETSYSGYFQYKKSYFGKKWPKIDQNCEKRGDFSTASTVFLLNR